MWSPEQLDRAAEARRAREQAKSERRLKVSRAPGLWTDCGDVIERPLVKLSGEWLVSVGFAIGTEVRVQVERERLVLTAVKEASAPLTAGER